MAASVSGPFGVSNPWLALGAALGLLAVAAGAFGAHGLKRTISPEMLQVFEVGVRYQMYHALGLCLLGALAVRGEQGTLTAAGALFLAGVVVFSGSLYALALGGPRWLGAVTPLGGLCFLGGWGALMAFGLRGR